MCVPRAQVPPLVPPIHLCWAQTSRTSRTDEFVVSLCRLCYHCTPRGQPCSPVPSPLPFKEHVADCAVPGSLSDLTDLTSQLSCCRRNPCSTILASSLRAHRRRSTHMALRPPAATSLYCRTHPLVRFRGSYLVFVRHSRMQKSDIVKVSRWDSRTVPSQCRTVAVRRLSCSSNPPAAPGLTH
jgi:hypothetical protein